MLRAGLEDRGSPSIRALARAAQEVTGTARPSVEAVRRLIHGTVASEPGTIAAVAGALRVDVRKVSGWAGGSRTVAQSYRPPPEADLLTTRQRKALDQIIRVMVEPHASSKAPRSGRGGTKGELYVLNSEGGIEGVIEGDDVPRPPTLDEIEAGVAAAKRSRRSRDQRR